MHICTIRCQYRYHVKYQSSAKTKHSSLTIVEVKIRRDRHSIENHLCDEWCQAKQCSSSYSTARKMFVTNIHIIDHIARKQLWLVIHSTIESMWTSMYTVLNRVTYHITVELLLLIMYSTATGTYRDHFRCAVDDVRLCD